MAAGRLRLGMLTALNRCPGRTRHNVFVTAARRHYSKPSNAFTIMYKTHGDPQKVLEGVEFPVADKLEKDQVLIKMLMAPINPSDYNMIEGTYMFKPPLPAIAGNEGVAEVLEVGGDVKGIKQGDWVIPVETGFGTWRTFGTVTADKLLVIDNDIPVLSAATLAVNPCTAYRMLKDFAKLEPGDVVIQNSANSGVGQSVIQVAKEWGFKTINVIRNRENLNETVDYLKGLGATHVVTEEFCRTPDMKELVKSTGAAPKLAFNGVGGKSATELLRHLGQKGVIVTYGGMSRQPVIVPTGVFIFKQIVAAGQWTANWNLHNKHSPERHRMLQDLCSMARNGALVPPTSELVPIREFPNAVKASMEGFQSGKKVLVMD